MSADTPEVYTFAIGAHGVTVRLADLSTEERTVLSLIAFTAPKLPGGRITQRELALHEKWMGAHPEHEAHLPGAAEFDTTLRKVRQVIRDLRIAHHAPILADKAGYFIPASEEEVRVYMRRWEGTVRAQIAGWAETYRELRAAFGAAAQSEVMEQQMGLDV